MFACYHIQSTSFLPHQQAISALSSSTPSPLDLEADHVCYSLSHDAIDETGAKNVSDDHPDARAQSFAAKLAPRSEPSPHMLGAGSVFVELVQVLELSVEAILVSSSLPGKSAYIRLFDSRSRVSQALSEGSEGTQDSLWHRRWVVLQHGLIRMAHWPVPFSPQEGSRPSALASAPSSA